MKIAYTSDMHTDITENNKMILPYLVNQLKQINPDIFVIAGDVSNTLEKLNLTLQAFKDLKCLKVMVPGNHDVWVESNNAVRKGKDSFYKYRIAIPEVCNQNGFNCPLGSPFILNDVAIVGNIGWYDYTLHDTRLANVYFASDYDKGTFDEGVWNDTKYAVWLKDAAAKDWKRRAIRYGNRELFQKLFGELKNAVSQVPQTINKLLVVLHTAPFRECIIPKDQPSPFDAYEGSTMMGEYIESIANDRQISIICGHRHRKLFLDRGNVKLYRSPVRYLPDDNIDLKATAKEVIGVLEF